MEESYGIVAGITGVFIAGLSALGITKRVPLTYRYRGCTNNQRRGAPLTNLAGVRYKGNKTTKFVSVVFLILLLVSVTFAQQTATVTLQWDAVTTNADGTPIKDLAGYTAFVSTQSGQYCRTGNPPKYDFSNCVKGKDMIQVDAQTVTVDFTNLPQGQTYYFVVTAHDKAGNHSEFSNEISKFIPVDDGVLPDKPAGLKADCKSVTINNCIGCINTCE